ncbi:hypothetical protein [Yoonia sp. 2307UL14-13]|uniref:hypothetical protein n=1 Tax=Yoonia sp. 2307UL14-13 TaxID=3126506 RepID=UPI0030994807
MRYPFLWMAAIWAFSACGGGSGVGADAPDYRDRLDGVQAMFATPAAALPTTGRLTYTGQMQIDLALPGGVGPYLGDAHMAFDFDSRDAAVTGTVDGFRHGADTLSGALTISEGRIYPDADPIRDYQFEAEFSGSLSAATENYRLSGEVYGDFKGAEAEAVNGVVAGTMRSDTDEVTLFDGSFFGIQD